MRKGIIFSMDVMFAVIVAALFIAAFYYYASRSVDIYPVLYVERVANDALIVLDKKGDLGKFDLFVINDTLAKSMSPNFGWYANLTVYNTSSDPVAMVGIIDPPGSIEETSIAAKRYFVTLSNSSIRYNVLITLRLWLR